MYARRRRKAVIRAIPWGALFGLAISILVILLVSFGPNPLTQPEAVTMMGAWSLAGILFAMLLAYLPTNLEAILMKRAEKVENREQLLKKLAHYRPIRVGSYVHDVIAEMLVRSYMISARVSAVFNDRLIIVSPEMSQKEAVAVWEKQARERSDKYQGSFRRRKREKEAVLAAQNRQTAFDEIMLTAPVMAIRDKEAYQSWLDNNQDGYGNAIFRYAENWARIMQAKMENGATLDECADEASNIADVEGITGFMLGGAVSVLALCWEYGEELRQWHNLKFQISDEGARANKTGGVLNPARLIIASAE